MGTEEGGAEIWRFQKLTLEESLALRSSFNFAMDFRHVWEELYGIPLKQFKGPTTWRFMAALLLSLQGKTPDKESVQRFVFEDKLLGQLDGDHFLCEFMPLPKRGKNSIEPYNLIWSTPTQYKQEVAPKRLQIILETLQRKQAVKLIISYDHDATAQLLQGVRAQKAGEWVIFKNQKYFLWQLDLEEKRKIYLLQTPFFGQGQISYPGIQTITSTIKNAIMLD
ncbi:hypothetical protein B0537_14965 [Desulforamulus ferrireducens]|uniref:Uncharacterized protein n=1 Tax=Desulforamulus ferrireducens TaxID=1833852 RepID=A0A1S6J0U8_9FIRM|nr:hypothetical protein B0537_14965 [Desulforamulus ferrireducens]